MIFAINGACGRMGKMLLEVVTDASIGPYLRIGGLVEMHGHPDTGNMVPAGADTVRIIDDPQELPAEIDVGLDFSTPGSGLAFAREIAARKAALVVGTTGLTSREIKELRALSAEIPVLLASNTSLGVLCLSELSMTARRLLGDAYDVEIVEMHHRHKKDAPSGTALTLGQRLASTDMKTVSDRKGLRKDNEIGLASARGGEVVGVHTVYFLGANDQIEITHRANSRKAFAEGAVRLALELRKKVPGMYEVTDLLR